MNTPLMQIKSLSKKYDSFELKDITLDIPSGCILGLVGQNGAGKSTLLKSIFQLISYNKGEILFDGKPIEKYGSQYKEMISFVSEEQSFYADMTIGWHINLAKRFFKNWDDLMAQKLLKDFDLNPKKKISELSKGMRIKLALLIGLSHKAKLLLLDEPTSGLDPIVRGELLQIMQEIMVDEGSSILFSSHISTDIEQISDYVAFLHNGRLVCLEDKITLTSDWKKFKFDKKIYTNAFDDFIIGKIEDAYSCSIISNNMDAFRRTFNQYHNKAEIVMDNASIDDILLHIIKGGQYA